MPGWALKKKKKNPSFPSTGRQPSFSCDEMQSQQTTSFKEATVLRWEWSIKAKVGRTKTAHEEA